MATIVKHEHKRLYLGGRWYGLHTDIVRSDNYTARVGYIPYASYGDNSGQWFYATWQYNPSFGVKLSKVVFTIQNAETPF